MERERTRPPLARKQARRAPMFDRISLTQREKNRLVRFAKNLDSFPTSYFHVHGHPINCGKRRTPAGSA